MSTGMKQLDGMDEQLGGIIPQQPASHEQPSSREAQDDAYLVSAIRNTAASVFESRYEAFKQGAVEEPLALAIGSDAQQLMGVHGQEAAVKIINQAVRDASAYAVCTRYVEGQEPDVSLVKNFLRSVEVSEEGRDAIDARMAATLAEAILQHDKDKTHRLYALRDMLEAKVFCREYFTYRPLQGDSEVRDIFASKAPAKSTPSEYASEATKLSGKVAAGLLAFSVVLQPQAAAAANLHKLSDDKNRAVSPQILEGIIEEAAQGKADAQSVRILANALSPESMSDPQKAEKNVSTVNTMIAESELAVPVQELSPEAAQLKEFFIANASKTAEIAKQQLPQENSRLVAAYADFIGMLARNPGAIPPEVTTLITQPQNDFIAVVKDYVMQSVQSQHEGAHRELLATTYANLIQLANPTQAAQQQVLDSLKGPQQTQPLPPAQQETAPKQRTPEEQAIINQIRLEYLTEQYEICRKGKWSTTGKQIQPLAPHVALALFNMMEARYGHEVFDADASMVQIRRESCLDPSARSYQDAMGLAQFIPPTWKSYGNGKDVWDPEAALDAHFRFMIDNVNLMKRYTAGLTTEQVLMLGYAAYFSGPGLDAYKRGELPDPADHPKTVAYGTELLEERNKLKARQQQALDAHRSQQAAPTEASTYQNAAAASATAAPTRVMPVLPSAGPVQAAAAAPAEQPVAQPSQAQPAARNTQPPAPAAEAPQSAQIPATPPSAPAPPASEQPQTASGERQTMQLAKRILDHPNISISGGRVKRSVEDLLDDGKTFLYDKHNDNKNEVLVKPKHLLAIIAAADAGIKVHMTSLTTGDHSAGSNHYDGDGSDYRNNAELFKFWYENREALGIDELIWHPSRIPESAHNLDRGEHHDYNNETEAAHDDHIHMATKD